MALRLGTDDDEIGGWRAEHDGEAPRRRAESGGKEAARARVIDRKHLII